MAAVTAQSRLPEASGLSPYSTSLSYLTGITGFIHRRNRPGSSRRRPGVATRRLPRGETTRPLPRLGIPSITPRVHLQAGVQERGLVLATQISHQTAKASTPLFRAGNPFICGRGPVLAVISSWASPDTCSEIRLPLWTPAMPPPLLPFPRRDMEALEP